MPVNESVGIFTKILS